MESNSWRGREGGGGREREGGGGRGTVQQPHTHTQVRKVNSRKERTVLELITWQLDKLENDTLPQVDLNVTEVCVDGEGNRRRGKGGERRRKKGRGGGA